MVLDTLERAASTPRKSSTARGRGMGVAGTMSVLAGLVLLGFLAWQFVGTNWVAQREHARLRQDLVTEWARAGQGGEWSQDAVTGGQPFALVRIPRFGADYEVPLVKGVRESDLDSGIGWFPDTAMPGEVGNFAIAAHRVTHGEPFRQILELRAGDEVVVETRTHIYTYRLGEDGDVRVVDFTETWVLDPVPGRPGATPTERLLTMVTCAELFHTDERNVVTGTLQTVQRKDLN